MIVKLPARNCALRVQPSLIIFSATLIVLAATAGNALAQKKYDTGATDTEIKIGNIVPYSGPLSGFGVFGTVASAYFKKISDEGGINGRKVSFISYDDAYSPPKTVEQARKLVESDEVLLIAGTIGTPTNSAIHKYMNSRKVPQLFVTTGATKWGDPKNFPWTMGWQPNYQSETRVYAKYILATKPDARIGIFYQNDDYGKDQLKGLKDGLGNRLSMIVGEESYEVSEPTIDSHIVKLKASGADVLISFSSPKFAAQTIRKMVEIGWKPLHILSSSAASVSGVLKPAGFDNSQDIVTASFLKDATDPQWKDDAGVKEFDAFLSKYAPTASRSDFLVGYAYGLSQTLVHVLKQCGDDLTRDNVMKQAANLKNLELGILLPGIKINTSPADFFPIEQMQLNRFKGERYEAFGDLINGEVGG